MFPHQIVQHFSLLIIVITLVLQSNYGFCLNSNNSFYDSDAESYQPAVATWYGSPTGPGSTGGACGYGNDVANAPYNGLVSAGNPNLYKSGKGCGACYQVKCTQNPACSGFPVTVTITDECPGCTDASIHFDLSGKAFGYMAKPGQADSLRGAGKIDIQYQRAPCSYSASITFKIDPGSNQNYLSFVVEYVNGDGDIGLVELLPSNQNTWISMQQLWGETWKTQLPNGTKGPFSVRLAATESSRLLIAKNVIPADWAPGQYYRSNINF